MRNECGPARGGGGMDPRGYGCWMDTDAVERLQSARVQVDERLVRIIAGVVSIPVSSVGCSREEPAGYGGLYRMAAMLWDALLERGNVVVASRASFMLPMRMSMMVLDG